MTFEEQLTIFLKQVLESNSSYKVFATTETFPLLMELQYQNVISLKGRMDVMSEQGLYLRINEIVNFYLEQRHFPQIEIIDIFGQRYYGIRQTLIEGLEIELTKRGKKITKSELYDQLEKQTYKRSFYQFFKEWKSLSEKKACQLETKVRELLSSCHDNIETHGIKLMIPNEESIYKIMQYLNDSGYEGIPLEDTIVYEQSLKENQFIEAIAITAKQDGYVVSFNWFYSKIETKSFQSLLQIFKQEIPCPLNFLYCELVRTILNKQQLEKIITGAGLLPFEYTSNKENVIINFGGTKSIRKILNQKWNIRLEPMNLERNLSSTFLNLSYNKERYRNVSKNNHRFEVPQIESTLNSEVMKRTYFYFFKRGCDISGNRSYFIKPIQPLEEVLCQNECKYFIAYLFAKIWDGDFRIVSSRFGTKTAILCLHQTKLSKWEVMLKYQEFLPVLEEMMKYCFWEPIYDSMNDKIFEYFGAASGQLDLAQELDLICRGILSASLNVKNCYLLEDSKKEEFQKKYTHWKYHS